MLIDINKNPYKADFPLLATNSDIAYLDSAATAQRPQVVLDAITNFYTSMNSNPLRGLYTLSQRATEAVDYARSTVAKHINATSAKEIVFTRNASESLNLVANTLGESVVEKGDDIVISIMEHHSNMLPWQRIAKKKGANIVWLYPNEDGVITQDSIDNTITSKTKIVAVTYVSNVLGSTQPIKQIADRVHGFGGYIVVDACQAAPHISLDVQDLNCDFLAMSAHKFGGPMGIGMLYGKLDLLEKIPPFLVGGEMIEYVTQDSATWAEVPYKFEAGTQDAAGIYASAKALEYMNSIGLDTIQDREEALTKYLMDELKALGFISILGPSDAKGHTGAVSFNVDGIHPHDVSSILDGSNVAIRAGMHCAQPLLTWLGESSSCRASISYYNDKQDIDKLISGLKEVWSIFNG